eukprot:6206408-Pleurochrysis_carterae.AAC.4
MLQYPDICWRCFPVTVHPQQELASKSCSDCLFCTLFGHLTSSSFASTRAAATSSFWSSVSSGRLPTMTYFGKEVSICMTVGDRAEREGGQ